MKRRLLLWMVTAMMTIVGVQNASAQASYNFTYKKGVTVAAGENYFLYNIGEAQFLTGGMDWGSRASTDHAGKVVKLTAITGGYSIYTSYSSANGMENSGYLALDDNNALYTDIADNNVTWVFESVDVPGYTNAYKIKFDDTYIYCNAADTRVNYSAELHGNYSYWILVPLSDREGVGDYTYLIQNTDFNRFWQRACWSGCTWGNDKFATGGLASNPCSEKYHGDLDLYQNISATVPEGQYTLYAQGFYRQDEGGTTAPVLYANDNTQALAVYNGNGENTVANMEGASTAFNNGQYVNSVQTTITNNGSLKVGINITETGQWVIWDNFALFRVGEKLSDVATTPLPANGNMAADTWYYYDVPTTDLYKFVNANPFSDIVYVSDGNLDVYAANRKATNFADVDGTQLTSGRYYIKSSSANHFELENITPSSAAQMEQLAAALTTAKSHTLGFDNGEYAPYNNAANLQAIAEAEVIDQTTPGNYTATAIAAVISGLQNATWTANNGEVNGIFWKTDYVAADIQSDTYIHPVGWTNTGYNTRVMCAAGGATNTGLNAVNNGIALFSKYNTTYGETTGYTLPLKANTYYKVAFKYCGWGNNPTTNVVLTGPNGTVQVIPGSFRPATSDGNSNADHWYEYTGVFKTGETAGNYVLALNKVETGQQQIAWGNMVLVRATTDDLSYTLAEGQMNVDIATAQQSAKEAFDADKSFENYAALNAAIDAAKASIAVYQQINTRLGLLTSENQRGGLTEVQVKAMPFYTKYSDGTLENTGTYTSLDEVLPAYKQSIADHYATNAPEGNDNLTAFIINPSLDFGNATGWSGGGVNQGNIEWYNGNYDVNQTLSGLPNGTYKLQAQGYYRPGGNDNTSDAQNALLYGGTFTTPVKLIASGGKSAADATNGYTTANTNSGSEVYVPNSQADAAKVFATGAYTNEVTFVVSNGTVKIGFKKDVLIANDWTCFDNFRLIYVSADAEVRPELVDAPMNAGIREAQQTALTTWQNAQSVDNYNALLAAIEAAQASADKYVIINARIPKLVDQSDGKVTEAALKAKYTSGEYVEADDVFTEYRNVIAAYYATNAPAADEDLTEFIINPSFEFGDTSAWAHNTGNDTGVKNTNDETYEFTHTDGDKLFNTWSNNNAFLYIVQQLEGLPKGTYELSAVWAAYNDTQIEFTAENVQPDGSINEDKLSFKPYDSDEQADAHYGVEKTLRFYVTDGTLKIGGHAYGFFKCDNFKLKFISTAIDAVDTNQKMNMYERDNYLDAIAAYDENPTPENLRELIDRKLIAENSIEAYKAAKATLDRVLAMMSKTNVYTYEAYFTIDDMYRKYGPEEGFYRYETLEDDVAFDLERMFFGSGYYRNYDSVNAANPKWLGDIPAVPFIASAWDCGNNGYAYRGKYEGDKSWQEGDDYYANTWSTEGLDDGTHMLNPYLEYWLYGDQLLDPRVMTATVEGTPNKEYSVKMFVRVRTVDTYYDREWRTTDPNHEHPIEANKPKGMSIQIGDGTPVVPEWQFIDNCESYYKLNNEHQLWVCNLWDYAEGDLPKGYVDEDGKLRIKFIIGGESNITWLSMKDVYVNYNGENLDDIRHQVETEVAYAKEHFVDYLGFDPNEYAPYTNVDELITYKRASQVNDASWNYFLLKSVYDKLYAFNHGGTNGEGTWTKNPEEMNGFYWTNDYTENDVKHVEWYGEEDDCITPSGWELIGRNDGFSTGIKKLGINTNDEGMKAIEGETGLLTKYETDYGKETGYTLPLKAGVKYILTFTCAYLGEAEFPTTISLSAPRTGVSDVLIEPLTDTVIQPVKPTGEKKQGNWYMYRATFVPKFDADYVILFDKDNVDSEPVMMGELTLVRYKEDAQLTPAQRLIDGTNQNGYSYTPDYVGGNFQVTRSWNSGGGTANGAYNTLVLPFKLSGNELKAALGENFDGKVYYYTGATYTGGDSYYTLNFEDRESGIFANVPVLIWSAADSPLPAWSNKTFEKTVTKYVKNNLTVDTDIYDLVGTYETIKIPTGASYLTPDNKFKKSAGKANLAATRAYFIPFDKQGNIDSGAKLMGFSIDDVPTGIMAIEEDGELRVTSGNIYSVDGRLIRQNATTLEGLPRGTYIVDGKKYMVK